MGALTAASVAPDRSPMPNTPGVGPAAAPMPPLPDFNTDPNTQPQTGNKDVLASLMSGIAPIKKSVDTILEESKKIVKAGVIPGSEQVVAQIVALATSLLPMAAQNLLNPMGGGGSMGPGLGQDQSMQMLPPSGGPAPM